MFCQNSLPLRGIIIWSDETNLKTDQDNESKVENMLEKNWKREEDYKTFDEKFKDKKKIVKY